MAVLSFSGSLLFYGRMWFHNEVRRMGTFFARWLPIVLWMGMIFIGSTDLLSSANTSRFLEPIVRWFKPDITWREMRKIHYLVRKGGHVTEYAILAILIWRAWPKPPDAAPGRGCWLAVATAIALATLYAATDEFHQSYYRSRTPSPADVLIDTSGAIIGISLVWLYHRFRHRKPAPE
jgi:VanZ family protein